MKKKNKGFTLIELLAVIVITGILTVMIMPRISNLVIDTRKKVYIQDAKKMIANAQYKMSSNSTEIEKPEMGECIIFSLNYLALNEFQNPPNDGKYLYESSFVVVKNEDGNYYYAVMLVEKRKDGLYQGVDFVTEEMIGENKNLKYVNFFDSSDIRYIDNGEDIDGRKYITTDYINKRLAKNGVGTTKWVLDDSIARSYDAPVNRDESLGDASSPKFTAKITPNNLSRLQATLTITASDEDDELKDLQVCRRVSLTEDNIYPKITDGNGVCFPYLKTEEDLFYEETIDFENDYHVTSEQNVTAFIYIVVSDPSGHKVKKAKEYRTNKNGEPKINEYNLEKCDTCEFEMPAAKVSVDITDDITATKDLEICFEQDSYNANDENYLDCAGTYKKYRDVFGDGNVTSYTFKNRKGENILIPDGTSHTLTIFVRDQDGLVNKETRSYNIYKNKNPNVITHLTPIPYKDLNGIVHDKNGLDYYLDLEITDDISDAYNIKVRIGNGEEMTYAQYKKIYMGENRIKQSVSGPLDGNDKRVSIRVWDQFQEEEEGFYIDEYIQNTFYNEQPQITGLTITGSEPICIGNGLYCINDGKISDGSYNTKIRLSYNDNTAKVSEIKVCASEKFEDCIWEKHRGNFMSIKTFEERGFPFTEPDSDKDRYATDDVRNLYINIIDTTNTEGNYNTYLNTQPYHYTIYKNKSPEVLKFADMISHHRDNNGMIVDGTTKSLSVEDDFNSEQLKYKFCYRIIPLNDTPGEFICGNYESFDQFTARYNGSEFMKVRDKHNKIQTVWNGEQVEYYVSIKDTQGNETITRNQKHTMFDSKTPYIRNPNITSETTPEGNNNIVLSFIGDDPGDKFQFCLKQMVDEDTVCNEDEYKNNPNTGEMFNGSGKKIYNVKINGAEEFGWKEDYDYTEEEEKQGVINRKFLLSLRDQEGLVTEIPAEIAYTNYISCKSDAFKDETIISYNTFKKKDKDNHTIKDNTEINTTNCKGKCYVNVKDHDIINKTFNKNDSIHGVYSTKVRGIDPLILDHDIDCERDTDNVVYCSSKKCFEDEVNETDNDKYDVIYVALDYIKTDERQVENGEEITTTKYNNEHCKDLIESPDDGSRPPLNSKVDPRCKNYSEFCGKDNTNCKNYYKKICNNDPDKTYMDVPCTKEYRELYGDALIVRDCEKILGWNKISFCENSAPFCSNFDELFEFLDKNGDSSDCPAAWKKPDGTCVDTCSTDTNQDSGFDRMNNKCIIRDKNVAQEFRDDRCDRKCAVRIDCTSEDIKEPKTIPCKGYYPAYKRIKDPSGSDNIYLIRDSLNDVCPELVNDRYDAKEIKDPKLVFKYVKSNSVRYVFFNPDEVTQLPDEFTLNSDIDEEIMADPVDEDVPVTEVDLNE